jgi:hypothetical protein
VFDIGVCFLVLNYSSTKKVLYDPMTSIQIHAFLLIKNFWHVGRYIFSSIFLGSAEGGVGFPNVVHEPGFSVEGCVYELSLDCLSLLDTCVGFPKVCGRGRKYNHFFPTRNVP